MSFNKLSRVSICVPVSDFSGTLIIFNILEPIVLSSLFVCLISGSKLAALIDSISDKSFFKDLAKAN